MTGRSIGSTVTARRVVMVAVLSITWCILWRDVSVANIVAGAAIAIGTMATGVGTNNRGGIRPIPLLRFFWLVLVDLIKSTVSVGLDTITPKDRTEESIIAVDLPPGGGRHHLLLIISITLTPGTAIVDADPDTGVVYIHVLYGHWRDDTAAHVQKLAQVAIEALPPERTEATA